MKINLKRIAPVLFGVAAVLVVGGIILLAFLVPNAASTFYRICLVGASVFGILSGVCFLYFLYLSRDNEPNFFLFDERTGHNISSNDLTFDRVNACLGGYMRSLAASPEEMWKNNGLDADPARFGAEEKYRPLAAYKMLYDLIEFDSPAGWQLFICAPRATIETLCRVLSDAGEAAMVDTLRRTYNSAVNRDDIEYIRDFIMGNAKYLRRRMVGYVQKNLEWFY